MPIVFLVSPLFFVVPLPLVSVPVKKTAVGFLRFDNEEQKYNVIPYRGVLA